ncbi:hypothetical protein NC652_039534 [Populus alba x Populus x berolinensis]|nr:hypothetical protein NC652_039534 [Populus alba x Populus x berolinensis]
MQRREVWLTWMQMWPVQMSTAVVVSSKVSTTLVTYADVSTITGQEEGVAQGNPKLDCQYDALGTEGMGMKIHYGEVGSCHLVDSKSN